MNTVTIPATSGQSPYIIRRQSDGSVTLCRTDNRIHLSRADLIAVFDAIAGLIGVPR